MNASGNVIFNTKHYFGNENKTSDYLYKSEGTQISHDLSY